MFIYKLPDPPHLPLYITLIGAQKPVWNPEISDRI